MVVLAGVASIGAAQEREISPAPAFSSADLTALPGEDWITNGGTIFNQRYSQLNLINRDNIGELKGLHRISFNGSGFGPGFAAEAQLLVQDGVIYVVTGADDVFAVDVESGSFLWEYKSNIDFDTFRVCCGRLSRGVGLGEGKVFVGQLDTKLVALDQTSGEVLWSKQVADPDIGYSITAAPLYYDGMVIVGLAGGEFGVRGRISAFDAKNGEEIWNFWTVPGPGEFGHDTWPQDNDAWKYGGAPVWHTPSVDPELGLLYFSTGNAGPDLTGSFRAGDNLFSVSILALDIRTGEYRWHFQEVHHDIWDYDAPNPVILFDVEIDGKLRHGLAQVSKSGYLFLIDRVDGSPLTPVIETPVPQDPAQATAATQPIPQGDWVVPHTIDVIPETFKDLLPYNARTYTPPGIGQANGVHYTPSWAVTWWPSSYNVETNLMYLCARDSAGGAYGTGPDMGVGPREGASYSGGGFTRSAGITDHQRWLLVAIDVRDHSAAWRRELEGGCQGSVTTAGGLIFVGRADGRLTALDSDTGQLLWEFQTDGGVDSTVTPFLYKGEQYLAVLAGGSLYGGKSNDAMYVFSLNGELESLPPGSANRVPAPTETTQAPVVAADRIADLASGANIYTTVCQACHGDTGEGGHPGTGAPLPSELSIETIMATADSGRPGTPMPGFRGIYTAEQLHDVATYIKEVIIADREE